MNKTEESLQKIIWEIWFDRSFTVTEENLLKYTELSYPAGMPDLMGTKEDDRTIGGEILNLDQMFKN